MWKTFYDDKKLQDFLTNPKYLENTSYRNAIWRYYRENNCFPESKEDYHGYEFLKTYTFFSIVFSFLEKEFLIGHNSNHQTLAHYTPLVSIATSNTPVGWPDHPSDFFKLKNRIYARELKFRKFIQGVRFFPSFSKLDKFEFRLFDWLNLRKT
jgi:hypothetical protein